MGRLSFGFYLYLLQWYSAKCYELQLVSKSRSANLMRYEAYADAFVMTFHVSDNTRFAAFKFLASEEDQSIFGCKVRKVSVYLKNGAPPLINPDGSPFPEEIKNISRSKIYILELQTDQKDKYINITSPDPGMYYAAIFLAYEDPRYQKISQQGLTQSCNAFVDASLFAEKVDNPTIVSEYQLVDVILTANQSRYFMFLVPDDMDHAIINIENVVFSKSSKHVILRVQARKPPTEKHFCLETNINSFSVTDPILFSTEARTWYYAEFLIQPQQTSTDNEDTSELNFRIRYFSNRLPTKTYIAQMHGNTTLYNISVVTKNYQSYKLTEIQPYTQYNLLRDSTSENFAFKYKLRPELDYNMMVPINVTSNGFSVLRFNLQKGADVGGTLQYILAFKPRIKRSGKTLTLINEPQNNIIVGCIQRDSIAVPTWPKYCVSNDISILSPLILNETISNATVLIPYPETGVWYASFKLFCGNCTPCSCPEACQQDYEGCTIQCEFNCTSASVDNNCESCMENCSNAVLQKEECSKCDCDGTCLRNSTESCSSSVIFDVSSRPCYYGDCGKQGTCVTMISEGIAYSTCLCTNKYRGFDCSDGSLATPYYLVLLEFLLLILSNVFFLPATYIAFKREYYVETLSYFSIFLSSSFYHACDAGENILTFCLFRLSALQFADFFSALLAIWLTLLAMADLPPVQLSLLQMGGSIIIAFCVTLNRYAFWIFALPSTVGLVVIAASWYMKYRKFRSRFMDKRYLYVKLPVGATVVTLGLIIYGLLQTQDNYKYLHSLWHIIMATGVFFLLPKRDTFQAAGLI